MLVLSRKRDETIIIGDNIVIKVLEIRIGPDGKPYVRLGIEAPRGVEVHRHEVWISIQEERNATNNVPDVGHVGEPFGARKEMEVDDGLDTAMWSRDGSTL